MSILVSLADYVLCSASNYILLFSQPVSYSISVKLPLQHIVDFANNLLTS